MFDSNITRGLSAVELHGHYTRRQSPALSNQFSTADETASHSKAACVMAATKGMLQQVTNGSRQSELCKQVGGIINQPHCVGTKIHSQEHVYPIGERSKSLPRIMARGLLVVHGHEIPR